MLTEPTGAQPKAQDAQRNARRVDVRATKCATGMAYLVPPPRPTTDAEIIRAGHALIGAKAILRGEFVAWVEAQCEFSVRSAQNYMAAAAKTSPWDDEMGWLAIPDDLPGLRGCDPLTPDEARKIAEHIEEELDRKGEPDLYGMLGALVQIACGVAPHATAGDVQRALDGHVRRAEAAFRRVEGIAAAFARLPADAPLWFALANQHWLANDKDLDAGPKLEVINAGRFDTRHWHGAMQAIRDEYPEVFHPNVGMIAYPPSPIWPTCEADVVAYRAELDAWLAGVPAYLRIHYPDVYAEMADAQRAAAAEPNTEGAT